MTDLNLRDQYSIGNMFIHETIQKLKISGDGFLLPVEEDRFWRMHERHGKAFALPWGDIMCIDLTIVEPMMIFIVPHVLLSLKHIPAPRAHISKLMELLKGKIDMRVLEPSSANYSNR